MKIYKTSLAKTIDSVNEAIFFNHKTTQANREEVAVFIASRQGLPHAYANMFAPTTYDRNNGIRLFTGELVTSAASLRHVSGEEASRALRLIKPKSKTARDALKKANQGMLLRLPDPSVKNNKGFFCCGTCDPALWRNITSGGLKGAEPWIILGMKTLKAHRENGKWRRYPFYYTLFALLEIDLPAARNEIKYAAPAIERSLKRLKPTTTTNQRRIAVLERALTLV